MKKLRKSLAVFLTLGMLAGTLPAPVLAEETVPEYPSSEVEGFNETGENQTERKVQGFLLKKRRMKIRKPQVRKKILTRSLIL